MFESEGVAPSALINFSIELFLLWIDKLIHIYQEQEPETDLELPTGKKYSKAYYTKKVN